MRARALRVPSSQNRNPFTIILADGVITLSTVVRISPAAAPGVNKFNVARLAATTIRLFSPPSAVFVTVAKIRQGDEVTGTVLDYGEIRWKIWERADVCLSTIRQ